MAFQQNLLIRINSVFNGRAFNKASRAVGKLQKAHSRLSSAFSKARAVPEQRKEVSNMISKLDQMGLEYDKVTGKVTNANGKVLKGSELTARLAQGLNRISKASKKSQSISKAIGPVKPVSDRLNMLGDTSYNLGQQVVQNMSPVKQVLNSVGKKSAGLTRQMKKGMDNMVSGMDDAKESGRKFRFEFLSVMFLGMRLKKTFSGLLKPAFKAAGVFDTWGSIMKILFLPIALDVLNVVLGILDWVSTLDKDTKKTIGRFAIFGVILGTVASIGGMLMLTLDGLASAGWVAAGSATALAGIFGAFLFTLIGLPLLVDYVASKFGELGGALTAVAAIAGLTWAAIGGPAWIIAAAIGGAIGLAIYYFDELKWAIGKFLVWFGDKIAKIVSVIFLPFVGLIDAIIMAVNAILDKDLDTITGSLGDAAEGLGKDLVESSDVGDKPSKPDDEKGGGIIGKIKESMSGLGGENLKPEGMAKSRNQIVYNDNRTNANIKGNGDKQMARKINKIMEQNAKNKADKATPTGR